VHRRYAEGVGDFLGAAGEVDRRVAAEVAADLDVLERECAVDARAECLGEGLLGGEVSGGGAMGVRVRRAGVELSGRQELAEEVGAGAGDGLGDAVDVGEVEAEKDRCRVSGVGCQEDRRWVSGVRCREVTPSAGRLAKEVPELAALTRLPLAVEALRRVAPELAGADLRGHFADERLEPLPDPLQCRPPLTGRKPGP